MNTVMFLKEFYRMCDRHNNCIGCPVRIRMESLNFETCQLFQRKHPDIVVACVEDWCTAHPQKTRLDDFKEKFPNFIPNEFGYPQMLPRSLGYCGTKICLECDIFKKQIENIRNPPDWTCWDLPVDEEENTNGMDRH